MTLKIIKITDYIYKNINNVWIMLNYKWNLLLEQKDFEQFYEYIYNLWLKLWIGILFKDWKKQYILEIYDWKSWAANNPIIYNEKNINKIVEIIEKNINNILNLPLLKWKVELIKNFKLFEWKIEIQDKISKKQSTKDKEILFNILKENVLWFLEEENYKNTIKNIDNLHLENIDYEVDKFDWEEIYWKNISIKNKSFFHYVLLFEDMILKDLNNWKRKKYSDFDIVEFIDDLNELSKTTEFIYFKIYKEKLEDENIILDKKKWLYTTWLEKFYFKNNLDLLTQSSYKLMFITKNVNLTQEKLEELEKKYNFKKAMRRDISDHLTILQDWNYIKWHNMYSTLDYVKNWISIMKYYRNDGPNNIFYWREYFSKNNIKFTPHKLIPKNDKWTFEKALHNIIVWDTWSWKSYFAYHLTKQIIKQENTQIIYTDPLIFEKLFLVEYVWKWKWTHIVDKDSNVIEVWEWKWTHKKKFDYFDFEIFKTPINIIWYISDDEVEREIKNNILFTIIFWKLKIEKESISLIKIKINKYLLDNIWNYFNYYNFKKYFNKELEVIKEKNIVLYESIKTSLELWKKIEDILSLENDLIEIVWKSKFVLFKLKNLFDSKNFEMINVMFELVKYLSKKNTDKYKYIFLDEIWNLLLDSDNVWKKQIITNWIDWLLRTIRQFNWIITMISQYYEDLKSNWLLAWVNMKIILDDHEKNTWLLYNEIKWKDWMVEKYIKIFNNIKKERKWLITINMWDIKEAMILDTENLN